MSLSAFGDKAAIPDEKMIAAVLADGKPIWDGIREHVRSAYKEINEEWKFYSRSAGWSLVVRSGKRTLFYFIPQNGYFKINFVLGGKAADAAQSSGLPAHILKMISEARPYAEGRSFMMDVKEKEDAGTAIRLMDIKDRN
jgi:hypothetical protein